MGSGDEDFAENAVDEAVRAANRARSAKKKAEQVATEVLALARKEIKRKAKIIDLRKAKATKKTMHSYFQSSGGAMEAQPLAMVFDGTLYDIPGAEANSVEEYPSSDSSSQRRSTSRASVSDTNLYHGSSLGSGETRVLSSKSPLITISFKSDAGDNANLAEVLDG